MTGNRGDLGWQLEFVGLEAANALLVRGMIMGYTCSIFL
jgi:hypothetical protein